MKRCLLCLAAVVLALLAIRETRATRAMLETEMRRALELDVTKSYEELLEEYRRLKGSGT